MRDRVYPAAGELVRIPDGQAPGRKSAEHLGQSAFRAKGVLMDSQGSPVSRRVVGPNSCPGSFVGKLASEYLGGTREDVEPVTETGQSCIKGRGLGGCLATARLRRTTGLELHSSGSVDVDGRSQTEKRASHVAVQVAVCIGVSPEGRSIFCNSRLFWVHQHQRPPRKSGIPAEGAERQGSKAPLSIAAECGTPSASASGVGHAKGPLLPASNVLALDTFLGCSWNLLRSF